MRRQPGSWMRKMVTWKSLDLLTRRQRLRPRRQRSLQAWICRARRAQTVCSTLARYALFAVVPLLPACAMRYAWRVDPTCSVRP